MPGTLLDQLPDALRQLPHEGLFLIVNDRYLPTEHDFRQFLAANWPRR